MTGSPRNRRRRGRRGPRQVQDGNTAATLDQQATLSQESGQEATPRSQAPMVGRQVTGGQSPDRPPPGARKRTRGKRRPNRRPDAIGPMPSEVLKEPFREARPTRRLERLELDHVFASSDDGLQFGCPMLTRTRLSLPFAGNQPSPRCSMGWALHSEQEVAMCLRTPDLLDCWKLDAQREERLQAELNQESAAD